MREDEQGQEKRYINGRVKRQGNKENGKEKGIKDEREGNFVVMEGGKRR